MRRKAFLANVHQSLRSGSLPQVQSQEPPLSSISSFDPYDLVGQFSQQAREVKSEVHEVMSHTAGCQRVHDIFSFHQAEKFISWADEFLPIKGLNHEIVERGFQLQDSFIPYDPDERRETQLALSGVTIGITGAMAGLADTGSVVITCGKGRGRLASLLPPIHIVLLEARLLSPSMSHFIRLNPEAATQSSNLVFITGPSRSADIEQTMTLGAHGPKELHVILITDEMSKETCVDRSL